MRVLLITPPMVQVNAPYPATAFLAGFLRETGCDVVQFDASLELALRLFSRRGVQQLRKAIRPRTRSASARHFLEHYRTYADTIDCVIRFLQGKDPTLAVRIASRTFLPEGPRFAGLHNDDEGLARLEWAFGQVGLQDLAVHLASLYLDDLADAIRTGVDSRFGLARYADKLAASAPSFDGIAAALRRKPTFIDDLIDELADEAIELHSPELVGLTVPFPGNVYGAFRIARRIKRRNPNTTVVLGGGYVNTELRELSEPRVFDFVDYVVLDTGEIPLARLVKHVENRRLPLLQWIDHQNGEASANGLVRVFHRQNSRVVFHEGPTPRSPSQQPEDGAGLRPSSTPWYAGLPLDRYFSMVEMPNPMHRIWSCGRWNKLSLAYGCYWHACGFCDTALDYIRGYSPLPADSLIDRILAVIEQTGQTGFHFIDEAMPPALLRQVAERLIDRNIQITWWGNIRFDGAFTPELTELLARSGCVAVTGGLEAATDRLLRWLNKGFTLDQAASATHAFSRAGIMIHAYLMYGCPSQTAQETVDALEFVRQLFEAGHIQSAYWHRFALTVHSPIYRDPARYGIALAPSPPAPFARNETPFIDPVGCDHDALGRGLRAALYNYMHGIGLDIALQDWFDVEVPPPTLPPDAVGRISSAASPNSAPPPGPTPVPPGPPSSSAKSARRKSNDSTPFLSLF